MIELSAGNVVSVEQLFSSELGETKLFGLFRVKGGVAVAAIMTQDM